MKEKEMSPKDIINESAVTSGIHSNEHRNEQGLGARVLQLRCIRGCALFFPPHVIVLE